MYECLFLLHYRIHMDIGNSENHLGITLMYVELQYVDPQVVLGVANGHVDAVVF